MPESATGAPLAYKAIERALRIPVGVPELGGGRPADRTYRVSAGQSESSMWASSPSV